MRRHKHDTLIREWLDNGMPLIEYYCPVRCEWNLLRTQPNWYEDKDYRIVYPPKPKKQIKMLCWYDNVTSRLVWSSEFSPVSCDWIRIPNEDKVVEVQE